VSLSDEPSYVRKLTRALKHLRDFKSEIDRYAGRHPYVAVRDRETDPNPRVWAYRAHLAKEPRPDLAVIIGDTVHNLRGALDHMAAALVPPSRKRNAKFPIVNTDIWAIDPDTGEHISGATDQLRSWSSAIKGMDPEAAQRLRLMQPYMLDDDWEMHPLAILNALDNADKHYELATVDLGIKDPVVKIKGNGIGFNQRLSGITRDGDFITTFRIYPADLKAIVDDQALVDEIINVMADGTAKMEVEITGEPQIGLQLSAIPSDHRTDPYPMLVQLDDAVITAGVNLAPYMRR
jgi:hypothetical protein